MAIHTKPKCDKCGSIDFSYSSKREVVYRNASEYFADALPTHRLRATCRNCGMTFPNKE